MNGSRELIGVALVPSDEEKSRKDFEAMWEFLVGKECVVSFLTSLPFPFPFLLPLYN